MRWLLLVVKFGRLLLNEVILFLGDIDVKIEGGCGCGVWDCVACEGVSGRARLDCGVLTAEFIVEEVGVVVGVDNCFIPVVFIIELDIVIQPTVFCNNKLNIKFKIL